MIARASTAILLVTCPDQMGLVSLISDFIFRHSGNILHCDQHQDSENQLFLMRVEWDQTNFTLTRLEFSQKFGALASTKRMKWEIHYSEEICRTALFVSQQDHCLADLLYRYRQGELRCEIPLIVSNHFGAQEIAEQYEIPFIYSDTKDKDRTELAQIHIDLLRRHQIDLVVLARYMQILSPEFVLAFNHRIINIHHSFLPAFIGQRPYHRAFERGVKLIGATSHFVTAELDNGPIIEQDVVRVTHRDDVEDMIQKGRDLERIVLSRALRWHLAHRVLVYGNKTVVFD